MTVYWRLLKEVQEIEIVMKAKTTSWVALGWRPQGLTGSCKKFPVLAEEPSSRSLKLGDTSEDSESEPEPESEPSDDKYDIDAEAEAETEPSSAAQTQSKRGKRKITSVDVGISYVSHSVSSNRNKRDTGAVSERQRFRSRYRSQYRPRFPRAFSIPLKDEDDPEEPTTAEPEPSKGKIITDYSQSPPNMKHQQDSQNIWSLFTLAYDLHTILFLHRIRQNQPV